MKQIRLFRKRYLPDETIELKDDTILSLSEHMLVTKWDVLKPRSDISNGLSAYFFDRGVKVSKIYNASQELVYWYCDIVEPQIDTETGMYIFTDLLIDILIYPDGHVEVLDLDEFADMMEQNILSCALGIEALRRTDHLLNLIYSGNFSKLAKYIEDAEKAVTCS
ncbi:DUF402 domain-containing protein [bacterium D16-51]|nr:DUF402 domain-containing protein [bacterium D16-59]RKI60488.1 DUF402 domain-containing protein [bacterium D16-51]